MKDQTSFRIPLPMQKILDEARPSCGVTNFVRHTDPKLNVNKWSKLQFCLLFDQEAQCHYRLGVQLEEFNLYEAASKSFERASQLKPVVKDYSDALMRAKRAGKGK